MDDSNESLEPVPASSDFNVEEVVLAFHGSLLYEARVLDVHRDADNKDSHGKEPVLSYTVHYQGWKKSWEETVSRDKVFEFNNENLCIAHKLLRGAQKRRLALHPVHPTEKEKANEKPLPPSSPSPAMFQIPPPLQRQLVDDWEFVTKENRLVPLPRDTTVENVLQKWVNNRRQQSDKATREVAEALQIYFDAALSKILLYRFERRQYVDYFHSGKNAESSPSPSSVYGPEHLLRLLHKLPYLLECTAVGKDKMQQIAEKVNELAKYMQRNGRVLFLPEYDSAPPSYVSKCDESV